MATGQQQQGLFGMGGMSPDQMQDALEQQRMMEEAKMTRIQRAHLIGGRAGQAVGNALGSLTGAPKTYDPSVQTAMNEEEVMKAVDLTDPKSILKAIQLAQSTHNYALANNLMGKLKDQQKAEREATKSAAELAKIKAETENLEAKTVTEEAKGGPKEVARDAIKSGKFTPTSINKYLETKNVADLELKDNLKTETVTVNGNVVLIDKNTGKTIKVLGSAKTSSIDALTAEMAAANRALAEARTQDIKDKARDRKDILEEKKLKAVKTIANSEAAINNTLTTAREVVGLAPETWLGGGFQAILSSVPWTDQKKLANLVQSLSGEKVLSTITELKSQSSTGATGFGAISKPELELLEARTRKLDPQDKNFKKNLTFVIQDWMRIEEALKKEREALLKLSNKTEKRTTASNVSYTVEED